MDAERNKTDETLSSSPLKFLIKWENKCKNGRLGLLLSNKRAVYCSSTAFGRCKVRTHKLYKSLLKIVTISSNKEIKLRRGKTAKVLPLSITSCWREMRDLKKNTLDHVTSTPTLSNFCITTLGWEKKKKEKSSQLLRKRPQHANWKLRCAPLICSSNPAPGSTW